MVFMYLKRIADPWVLLAVGILFTVETLQAHAQTRGGNADDIIGTYKAFDRGNQETLHLNFYKADNGEYEARIVWMEQPTDDLGKPRTDVHNPHSEQRHIPLSHLVIVRGLHYDARDREWVGGRVYDPMSGKTYRCFIDFEDDETLRLKGYIGFRILGRSLYWQRIED